MYRYDNLQAFDGSPIEVTFDTGDKTVTEAWAVFNNGALVKKYTNPTSPIEVELDEDDTGLLSLNNVMNLILFDDEGRKLTCEGELKFTLNKEVIADKKEAGVESGV